MKLQPVCISERIHTKFSFLIPKCVLCKSCLNTRVDHRYEIINSHNSVHIICLLAAFMLLCASWASWITVEKISAQSRKAPYVICIVLYCAIRLNMRSDNWQQHAKLSLTHPKISLEETIIHSGESPWPAGVWPRSLFLMASHVQTDLCIWA